MSLLTSPAARLVALLCLFLLVRGPARAQTAPPSTPAPAPAALATASIPVATADATASAVVEATPSAPAPIPPEPLLEVPLGNSHPPAPPASPSEEATDSVAASVSVPVKTSVESLLAPPPVVVPRPKTLMVLHTNDWYGLFDPVKLDPYSSRPKIVGGLSRAAALIDKERSRGIPTLLLCSGNVLGPNMVSAATRGKAMVEAMNRMGYDAWLPSNHDFNYGLDVLRERIREASASAVLTNVRWAKTDQTFARPYALFERGGLKVAVLGLVDQDVVQYIDFAEAPRITIDPPMDAVARWVPLIRRAATPDVIVAMTHLSLDREMALLTRDSGVDLVIGGFNTTNASAIAIHEVVGVDGKRALHAGGFGTAVGKARLTFEPTPQGDYQLARIEPGLIRLDDETLPYKVAEATSSPIVTLSQETKRLAARAWTEESGKLARLAEDLESDQVMGLVPEIMRLQARSEVGVVPRSFFHNERVFGPINSPRALLYAMPWEDALSVVELKGSQLSSLYYAARGRHAFFAGLSEKDGAVWINGRPLESKANYTVASTYPATRGKVSGLEGLAGGTSRVLTISVRRAVLRYFRQQGKLGREVSLTGFPDYFRIPFWKSSLQFTTDLQRRQVDADGKRYPDLSWKADKSGMSWGGDLTYDLGTNWGPHELDNTLNLSYHSDQLSDGKSQTSSDKIQLVTDYRSDTLWSVAKPYATLTLTTRFNNDQDPRYFLGQLGTGVSHPFPFGLELREGIEYRHHFFDPKQADKTGGTFQLAFKRSVYWLNLQTDLKLFATPDLGKDGLLIDDESVFSVPLTETTALSYKVNLYRNTLYPDWANRHLLGVTFKFTQPWLF